MDINCLQNLYCMVRAIMMDQRDDGCDAGRWHDQETVLQSTCPYNSFLKLAFAHVLEKMIRAFTFFD